VRENTASCATPLLIGLGKQMSYYKDQLIIRELDLAHAAVDSHKRSQLSHDIGVKELQWDLEIQRELKNAGVKEVQFAFLDKIKDNVELTKVQTANIDVKTTPQGGTSSFNLSEII
jgi:hypothetical protein